jgi:hypothetical protein
MEKFFESYIDITAIITALVIALIFKIISLRNPNTKIWALPAFFTLFGPAIVIVFMSAHLSENIYRAINAAMNGTFVYDFRYYSILLLGTLIVASGVMYLNAAKQYISRRTSAKKVLFYIALIVVVTAPLIPIVSIAAVPSIACAISLAGLPFVHRGKKIIADRTISAGYSNKKYSEYLLH